MDNPRNKNQTIWWNMGIFLVNSPTSTFDVSTHSLSFEGLDLMAKLSDKRGGQLPAVTTIVPAGSKVADVVKQTITQLGGFDKYVIEDEGLEVPYDIKKEMGSTIYDLLAEIRDLYADWEMFFDVDGVFHWQKIPSGKDAPVVLDFDQMDRQVIISEDIVLDFENVKNNIIVYGRLLDNGHQVFAYASDTLSNSPFRISSIGQINYIVNDERIYNDDLAGQRARYELYLHARMNDSIDMEIVPIFWLNDVNIKIKHTKLDLGIDGEYLIKSLTIPLGVGGTMSINAIKLYDEEVVLKTAITEAFATGQVYTSKQEQMPRFPNEGR